MKFLKLTLIVFTIGFSTNSNAEYTATIGSYSCNNWNNAYLTNNTVATQSWLLGYLDGVAMARVENFLEGVEARSIFLWMDNYCRAHPSDNVSNGAYDLHQELINKRH